MTATEELFISISPGIYRQNKSGILMSEADLLQILKHLQNMKVLSRKKNDLKIQFKKLISSTMSQIKSLQNKMPAPKIPEKIQKKKVPKQNLGEKPKIKKTFSKRDKIENELKLINEKLRELNS